MTELRNRAERLAKIQKEIKHRKWSITLLMRVSGLSYPTCHAVVVGYRIPYETTLDRLEKVLGIIEKIR